MAIMAREELIKIRIPNIGVGLKACRVSAGLTQQQVADALGKDITYVSKIENGHMIPDTETHYLWIEITKSPRMMFYYIYGSGEALQTV